MLYETDNNTNARLQQKHLHECRDGETFLRF